MPGRDDRPFLPFSTGVHPPNDPQFPDGRGLNDTFFRSATGGGPSTPRLFDMPGDHPFQKYEALTKIYNHLTTRSNVFAVWLTVGFFEVTDDTTRPVKLGAEVGRAENRHVRRRMFAILDRTNLSIASNVRFLSSGVPSGGGLFTVQLDGPSNGQTPSGIPWSIEVGSTLLVDVGDRQEAVVVTAVDPGQRRFTARFAKSHDPGAPVALPNVPGEPPIFLQPLAVTRPDPANRNVADVTVAVDPGSTDRQLIGQYEGIPWEIRPGSQFLVDLGPDQEVVTVRQPVVFNGAASTGTFQVTFTRPHPESFPITNTLLGNPGPQPRFDPRRPPFSAIVRYVSIIQ